MLSDNIDFARAGRTNVKLGGCHYFNLCSLWIFFKVSVAGWGYKLSLIYWFAIETA